MYTQEKHEAEKILIVDFLTENGFKEFKSFKGEHSRAFQKVVYNPQGKRFIEAYIYDYSSIARNIIPLSIEIENVFEARVSWMNVNFYGLSFSELKARLPEIEAIFAAQFETLGGKWR